MKSRRGKNKKREREKRNQGLLHIYTKKNSQRTYYPGSLLHVPHNEAPFTSAWFLRGKGREGVDSCRKIDTRTRSELHALPRSISNMFMQNFRFSVTRAVIEFCLLHLSRLPRKLKDFLTRGLKDESNGLTEFKYNVEIDLRYLIRMEIVKYR